MRAVSVVRKTIVGDRMIELRRRLIALRGPACTTVRAHVGAAVIRFNYPVGVRRINPESVIVAVGNANGAEGLAAIDGAIHSGVENIDGVRRARIGEDMRVIESPLAILTVAVHQSPVVAAIIGAEEPALVGFNQSPHAIAVRVGDVHYNAAKGPAGQTVFLQVLPGRAAVRAAI